MALDPSNLFLGSSGSVGEVLDLAVLYASLPGPLLLLGPILLGPSRVMAGVAEEAEGEELAGTAAAAMLAAGPPAA